MLCESWSVDLSDAVFMGALRGCVRRAYYLMCETIMFEWRTVCDTHTRVLFARTVGFCGCVRVRACDFIMFEYMRGVICSLRR